MCETGLIGLNLIIAVIGVCFVLFGLGEYLRLRKLRADVDEIRQNIDDRFYLMQKAMHRVMASYDTDDADRKIALLKSAIKIYPEVFNGYNALGYTYLEQGKVMEAINAFKDAVHAHPEDKAGYFDLAHALLRNGNRELCMENLRKAIEIDPTARQDLKDNPLFREIWDDQEYMALQES